MPLRRPAFPGPAVELRLGPGEVPYQSGEAEQYQETGQGDLEDQGPSHLNWNDPGKEKQNSQQHQDNSKNERSNLLLGHDGSFLVSGDQMTLPAKQNSVGVDSSVRARSRRSGRFPDR